jgi:hypothetical protein
LSKIVKQIPIMNPYWAETIVISVVGVLLVGRRAIIEHYDYSRAALRTRELELTSVNRNKELEAKIKVIENELAKLRS